MPNGATQGAAGTIASLAFSDVAACTSLGFVLPVKLVSFTAVLQESKVALNWITVTETNSNRFEIEKSTDGQNFTNLATVAATGNSTTKIIYTYADISGLNQNMVYYRLKMVDTDNKFSYSEVRVVRFENQTASDKLIMYPNPTINNLHISLPIAWQGKNVRFEMYDVTGKLVSSIVKNNAAQTELVNMKNFGTGYYVIRASMGTESVQQKVIKG